MVLFIPWYNKSISIQFNTLFETHWTFRHIWLSVYMWNVYIIIHTLKVSSTFSDSSRNLSISSLNSSISRCAMSHFCSAVSFNILSIVPLRDFDRLRPTLAPPPAMSYVEWDGVLVMAGSMCVPAPSLGSTRFMYFSNIWVSAPNTSLARL